MSEENGQTDVVVRGSANVQAVPEFYWLKELPGGVATSLNLETQAGKIDFVRCQQQECAALDDFINKEIQVRDVLFHPAKRENPDTGEVNFWNRCVLFAPDGSMIHCGSQGIAKSLALATFLFGNPPWPGIKGTVKQVPIGDSKRWYQIEWDLSQCPNVPNPSVSTNGRKQSKKENQVKS